VEDAEKVDEVKPVESAAKEEATEPMPSSDKGKGKGKAVEAPVGESLGLG
jgi:hypothetical protein